MRLTFRRLTSVVLSLALLAGPAALLLWQRQNIFDWVKLHGYQPPAQVSQLASQDTMTPYAKHLFYVNHAQVVSGVSTFRNDCPESEQSIVLGCYKSGDNGIYIFDPSNPQLNGLEQVTAAHETLHAAYDRLSTSDKNYVDGLLQNYYKHDLTDSRIKSEIKLYQKTEPNDVVNEMHSVFGTEASNLPAPLENYYKRYFTSRKTIVAYSDSYQAKFTSLQTQVSADDTQLAALRSQIEAEEASLEKQSAKIDADRSQLNQERSGADPSTYNAQVAEFNAEVDNYNAGVRKVQTDINVYNDLVARRNAIAKSLASLDASIDTRITTKSTN